MKAKPKNDCLLCGEKCKRTTTKFCSRYCMNAYRTKHCIRQGGPQKQLQDKTCRYCKEVFSPIRATHKFCSKKCSAKHRFHVRGETGFMEKAHESARNMTKEQKQKLSIAMTRRNRETKIYTRGVGGIRKDIGHYVRSRWEANVARLLNYLNVKYKYEYETFHLNTANTNEPMCTYTPDFKIAEDIFIEVKGWETIKAKHKRELMKEQFPNTYLIYITEVEYKKLSNQYKDVVPNWEFDKNHGR